MGTSTTARASLARQVLAEVETWDGLATPEELARLLEVVAQEGHRAERRAKGLAVS